MKPMMTTKPMMTMKRVLVTVMSLYALATGTASAESSYVGNKACSGCHKAEFADWQRSAHGKSVEVLSSGKKASAKSKAGLADKDYSKDDKCLKCHTTGFGKDGGFKSMDSTPELAGIGCESCHGPGSDYREIHKKKMLDFKRAETKAAGQTYASKGDKVCEKCHNADSPFKAGVDPKYAFDLKERLKSGTESFHQINPLDGNHD